MMRILENYEPKEVFKYFEEISAIPRGSRNTVPIADYLEAFAKKQNLEYIRDELDNVIIIKEAAKGYESVPAVIIQGHTDMVCEKMPESNHDFMRDGLQLEVNGDFLSAKDTSLGGDDGIAVAYSLAILADDSIEHPRIEAVFTSDEEIGLLGAAGIDLSKLQAKRLINIDSEEEGHLLVSCAGGCRFTANIPVFFQETSGIVYDLTVEGLAGGHSGTEIQKQLGNSNMLMGRLLYTIGKEIAFSMADIEGGMKDNAIPRITSARIVIGQEDAAQLEKIVKEYEKILKHEYEVNDPDVKVTAICQGDKATVSCLDMVSKEKIIFYLMNIPNGVQGMSQAIEGLVETSLNLGICKLTEDEFCAKHSVRSSIESCKHFLNDKLIYMTEFLGGTYKIDGDYPGWEYRKESPLRQLAVEVFKEQYGREPILEAIHAGLECGLLASKIEDLDCISLGPDMFGAHTTEEKLSISSTQRVWKYLIELLRRCQ
jgi:dipeptidase D